MLYPKQVLRRVRGRQSFAVDTLEPLHNHPADVANDAEEQRFSEPASADGFQLYATGRLKMLLPAAQHDLSHDLIGVVGRACGPGAAGCRSGAKGDRYGLHSGPSSACGWSRILLREVIAPDHPCGSFCRSAFAFRIPSSSSLKKYVAKANPLHPLGPWHPRQIPARGQRRQLVRRRAICLRPSH